jgi:acyl carrier protein
MGHLIITKQQSMDTIEKIQTIFKEKFLIEIQKGYFSENVSLGPTGIGFDTIDLYYFIHFIESEFNIKFSSEHFVSGVIRTLPGLCQTIKELCKEAI